MHSAQRRRYWQPFGHWALLAVAAGAGTGCGGHTSLQNPVGAAGGDGSGAVSGRATGGAASGGAASAGGSVARGGAANTGGTASAGAAGGRAGTTGNAGAAGNDVPWNPPPIQQATVYGFSQMGLTERDPQLFALEPDVVIRAWGWWDIYGHRASDYDFSYVRDAHAAGILFTGGGTASVLFRDEVATQAEFEAWVSRDASGNIPPRSTPPILYRATLANPAYRAYLIAASKLQIDGGVDALSFDELNGSYFGPNYDHNEGYDDFQIGDFNDFLLNRYPASTDFQALFGMTPDNTLRRDVPSHDLTANFNYRKYLAAHGWTKAPSTTENPLALLWGATNANYPDPDATSFVDTVVPGKYWKEIADAVRAYARDKYGRKLLLTSNGVHPYVDFQSVGLYDYNRHLPSGESVDYVPMVGLHLAGRSSLAPAFRVLKARSERFVPGAPVVMFIDWPGTTMDRYVSLPAAERRDYWRMYAAEAYANGTFFAFHLKTSTGEPSATEAGVLDLLVSLAQFYRSHGDLYHGVSAATVSVSGAPASAMVAVSDQASPHRRIVHVVNHEYDQGFITQKDVTLRVQSSTAPTRVRLASPDLAQDVEVPFTFANGQIKLTLPSLQAYDIAVISY